jgi:hypothetical protein
VPLLLPNVELSLPLLSLNVQRIRMLSPLLLKLLPIQCGVTSVDLTVSFDVGRVQIFGVAK